VGGSFLLAAALPLLLLPLLLLLLLLLLAAADMRADWRKCPCVAFRATLCVYKV